MEPFLMNAFADVASGVTLAALLGLVAMFRRFAREQRAVNAANEKANRSMQRDVLYRYFAKVVERGESVTPDEYAHIEQCYGAYHANGGNGAGTLMWEKIRENVRIDTGRE